MSKRTQAAAASAETKRCAIYTRKSTAAGLEQEFNSLDAQYESCEAYIARQPSWKRVDRRYDDGGFTGANLERPAFQRLMADIEAGEIDVVVVYKVDRLSRSLLDFARVMERFGASGASFVSVTQNFSTADAMGRLTLNMLISFAEFEREMIAERTRDKIAAARRKGKWTGGPVPFGFSVRDKRLVPEASEAAVVREAFELFLRDRRTSEVARELNRRGLVPRVRVRAKGDRRARWTKDRIARLLDNPLYAGFVHYGNELHAGEHPALVGREVWERARAAREGRATSVVERGTNPDYVLRGLLRCGRCGYAMTPASTRKGAKVHRYYRFSQTPPRTPRIGSMNALPRYAWAKLP